jgi:LPS sulfotransferase NodH
MESPGRGKNELLRIDEQCSERWDSLEDQTPRFRYVVLSGERTRSGLLCDYLAQRGIGLPIEYFNLEYMQRIGKRLGCMLPDGRIDVPNYMRQLEAKRARNGIFGTKLQPSQLLTASNEDVAKATALLRRFDRAILLRRRDKLLQAISLARAHLTDQWHIYGDDPAKKVSVDDERLFGMIGARLGKIREDERYVAGFVSTFAPSSVRMLWYEDLSSVSVLEATASWLWHAAGGGRNLPESDQAHELPTKMDESEAHAIKARFLSAVGMR